LEVTRIPREVLAKEAREGDIVSSIFHDWDVSGATVGTRLDNDLFPGWNPKKVIDAITQ
jgi:hypothetical protein